MATKVLLVNTAAETVQEARELTPPGFELIVAPPGSADYAAALADTEYLLGNVDRMDDDFYRSAPRAAARPAVQRRLQPRRSRSGAPRRRAGRQQRRRQLACSGRAHDPADARGVSPLVPQHEMTSGGRWRGNQPMPTFYEMHGKTLGIIGLGTIGKRVARIAAGGFDMRIQYNDIVRLTEDAEDALHVRYRLLPELLPTSDIVTLHVPLTRLTRNMISARELGLHAAARGADQLQPRPGDRFPGAARRAEQRQDRRRGARRVPRRTAIAVGAGAVAGQRRADTAPCGSEPGDAGEADAQRLRQRAPRAAVARRPLWVVPELRDMALKRMTERGGLPP